ncbi:MAG TPA: biotin-dependent carboxyltransferase family protein [Chitinophagaceae bacterium]
MSIRVLEPGLTDTIQDHGRYGMAVYGINHGGAMDRVAASVSNFLVGNDESEAVIEMHFPAPVLQFEKPALIAISGGDFAPHLNGQPVPVNTPVVVETGSVLEFPRLRSGARSYLAVRGGLRIEKWLGSYSTNLRAKAGGLNGAALAKGDQLPFRSAWDLPAPPTANGPLPWHADVLHIYHDDRNIHIIPGQEHDFLSECSVTIFEGNTFLISAQSDRMGFRLNGSPLQLEKDIQLISSAVSFGTIQLLPNGQLIILMADHQTTGGYPRIAHVISADLARLAQLQPHTAIRFLPVSLDVAQLLLTQQHHHLQQVKHACLFRLNEYFLMGK